MVALVQSASTAPSLLLGLFAGALADLVDRRRVILITQIVLFAATATLGIITLLGATTPGTLLAFTFLIGACFTFYLPAQSASINDLVARNEIPRAVALGAVAFNVARAVGPALAGAAVAWLSSGSALVGCAFFFVVMIVAMRGWKSPARAHRAMPETLMSGIESGLRYTRHSPPMRAFIVHNVSFALCACVVLALMPVIARDQLELGAGGFGFLSASFGIGAIVSALLVPRGLHRTSLNTLVTGFVLLWIVGALLIASAGLHGGRAPRGGLHGRGLDGRLFQSVRRNADLRAGVGAGPRGRDEPDLRAGVHGAGQRFLGLARFARRHAHRARRGGRAPCSCCLA
jgi:MFS family permease